MGCKIVQFWQNCTDNLSVPAVSVTSIDDDDDDGVGGDDLP
jgi:hypothetical protein